MDEGGDWKNEVWAALRAGSSFEIQRQVVGARPWILGHRSGLARGIYDPLLAEGRFSGRQISSGVQWRLHTLVSEGGNSAYQLVFGPDSVSIVGSDDKDEDLLFAREAS